MTAKKDKICIFSAQYFPNVGGVERYTYNLARKLLEKGVWANFNSVRVWGGGYYPEDWFYDFCDEFGFNASAVLASASSNTFFTKAWSEFNTML